MAIGWSLADRMTVRNQAYWKAGFISNRIASTQQLIFLIFAGRGLEISGFEQEEGGY